MTKKELIVSIQELNLNPKVEKEILKIAKLLKSFNVDYRRVLGMFFSGNAITQDKYLKLLSYFDRYYGGCIF